MSERGWGLRSRVRESETATVLGQTGFRRLYAARTVSRTGDALYTVAAVWLAFELTGSTLFSGLAFALSRLPAVASVFIGPLVDRAPLGRLLPAVEVAQGVVVLAVPAAALVDMLNVWVVLGTIAVTATLRRVSAPAGQAALARIVEDDLLARANSVSTSTVQAVGAGAEWLAGALIVAVGAVSLFVLDAITFAASALLLTALYVPPAERTDDDRGEEDGPAGGVPSLGEYVADIREGVATVRKSVLVHALAGAVLATLGTGLGTAVLPAFGDTLGGPRWYGLLVGATTAGTLAGSLVAGRLADRPLGWTVVVGFVLAATGRVGAALVESPLLAVACFGVAAVPVGVYNVLLSTVVQVGVPDRLLARVSSTVGTVTAVVGSVGLLGGGVLGTRLDATLVIGLSGGGYLLLSAYWFAVPRLRSFAAVSAVESGAFDPEVDGSGT